MNFVAIDLGATSGRTILGSMNNGRIELREVNRFPNRIIQTSGHYYWDLFALYQHILDGLKILADENVLITSIGVDTWGVDFVCLGSDGEILRQPYCYRDPHTVGSQEEFFKIVPSNLVYEKTGIQFMNFNSLFQLFTMQRNNSSILPITDTILFMPDAISYLLTGCKVTEYTIASTAQLVNAETKSFDIELLNSLKLTPSSFGEFVYPGTKIGYLTDEVQQQTGLSNIPVIAVAGHDTASAVAAVPATDSNFAYLSSGTWSLMGIETEHPIINEESYRHNFTNEGGVDGKIRFLKNICGFWLLEQCRLDWGSEESSYSELITEASKEKAFQSFINPDAVCFANPVSMVTAIQDYCKATNQIVPTTKGQIVRCIFESLAFRYKQIFMILQGFSSFPIERLHVIGGGSKNRMLNTFTASALGVPVIAGPTEATAIGNIMMQAKAAGVFEDFLTMRKSIAKALVEMSSEGLSTGKLNNAEHNENIYLPLDVAIWDEQFKKYLDVFRENISK
jgi:rhamnulokinase